MTVKQSPKNISRFMRLLLDPRVEMQKKVIFFIVTALYWIFPDFLPFIPLDDILFTLLAAWLFSGTAEKDLRKKGFKPPGNKENDDIIDVEGYTIEDKKR